MGSRPAVTVLPATAIMVKCREIAGELSGLVFELAHSNQVPRTSDKSHKTSGAIESDGLPFGL